MFGSFETESTHFRSELVVVVPSGRGGLRSRGKVRRVFEVVHIEDIIAFAALHVMKAGELESSIEGVKDCSAHHIHRDILVVDEILHSCQSHNHLDLVLSHSIDEQANYIPYHHEEEVARINHSAMESFGEVLLHEAHYYLIAVHIRIIGSCIDATAENGEL